MYFDYERINKIAGVLKDNIFTRSADVKDIFMKEGGERGGEKPGADLSAWKRFLPGERWGGKDKHCWFRMKVRIPAEFSGQPVVFELKTGNEGLWDARNPQFIIYVDGRLMQGLDVNHTTITLAEEAKEGQECEIALHSYSGVNESLSELNARICAADRETERLYYNIAVPLEVTRFLGDSGKNKADITNFLIAAINMLDLRKPNSVSFRESVKKANRYLEEEFYGKYCGRDDITAYCIGHTHIDVAWLWTLAQTREKTVRSFSTVLNLMKRYPEYKFMSSQPQLYKFFKEEQPELYEEIKARIAEGRWEAEGAMWLEADCNLASGESLVRQVLFGKRFFNKEFGVDSRILWLPDVFGYSAALPQILKKAGVDYFMTSKISWNEYNKMPYDTFMWKGLDGTEILSHYITTRDLEDQFYINNPTFTTYVGMLKPSHIMGAWERYQQKDINNEVLVTFGYGDGGGGPTAEMLEQGRRMAKGIPGCPKVRIGNPLEFFKGLEKRVSGNRRLPEWVGELYLEYHRGTYTSMARNKKYNRKSEFLYQDAELLSSIAAYAKHDWSDYRQEEINGGWETILLNQFHDILPGSSVREVYEDSLKDYIRITDNGNRLVKKAAGDICRRMDLEKDSLVVFNQLGFERSDIVCVELPEGMREKGGVRISEPSGKEVEIQYISEGKAVFIADGVPAKGCKAYTAVPGPGAGSMRTPDAPSGAAANTAQLLENKYFRLKLDKNGHFVSIYDKRASRELLRKGQRGNVLQAFEDIPHNYDAWDINIYYREKMWELTDAESITLVEDGPVRSCLRIVRRFLDSDITQYIYIYNGLPRIDFRTVIDWKEKHILLKAAFPLDIHADRATYEIQYGNVERPTHWNTSWDYARFEVCGHKWADLSEDGYGVSLLNDCKYGHDIKDGVMRLSLLKSATDPNTDADREIHEFTYSLFPHEGGWREAGTVMMAYSLNCPMYSVFEAAHKGDLPSGFSFVSSDSENVVIEAVKKAEDGNELIVRVYEAYNRRTNAKLSFMGGLSGAWECDLLENNIERLETSGNCLRFEIRPYEIKTFKVKLWEE